MNDFHRQRTVGTVSLLAGCLAAGVLTFATGLTEPPSGLGETQQNNRRWFGLAVRYPGDRGIEKDPRVVFAENFEIGTIADLEQRWGFMKNNDGDVIAFSDDVPRGSMGQRSLQMTATRGQNTGGELYKTFDAGWDQIYLRFYAKFAEDHGFLSHFVALRGFEDPLPYPVGGAGQLAEDYFSITIDPTINERNAWPFTRYPPPGVWQFYVYWPEMRSWQTVEGEPDGRPNPYFGNGFYPEEAVVVPRGAWVPVEFMVKLNSSPETHDGEMALWIDGQPIVIFAPGTPDGYWVREVFRNDPDHPDAEAFEGFRWRTDMDVKINVLRLQHYVANSAFNSTQNYANDHPDDQVNTEEATVWFDNVVMATEYIGPMVGPPSGGNEGDGRRDRTPPSVTLTAPSEGATVSGTASVTADASDNVGVVGVQFTLDGANLGPEDTSAPYSASWDTTAVADGAHTLTAVARDATQNTTTSAPIDVTVANDGGSGIFADSTFNGYRVAVIDDGIVDAFGGTATTWASAESSTAPHWVAVVFDEARTLDSAAIHWAYNNSQDRFMTSQEVEVQLWDGAAYQTVATTTYPGQDVPASAVSFPAQSTTRLRFFQPAGQGHPNYSIVMWLTEIDYGG